MESFDSSQTLDLFVQSDTAICGLDTTGLEALAAIEKGWPYLVVLNSRDRPQGMFSSQCVLNWLRQEDTDWLKHASQTLADITLEPLPSISASTTVAEFLTRISQYQHSASIWALVERDHRYVGVVEVLPLLQKLACHKRREPSSLFPFLQQSLGPIEQLPLPLAIRNAQGEVLGTNRAWQDCIALNACWHSPETQKDRAVKQSIQKVKANDSSGKVHTWMVTSTGLTGELEGLEIAIAQDITGQEQLAWELSGQNADLVRLNRLKDEFLACISHELKTPLTSIIGMSSLLSAQTVGDLNERQNRYVKMILYSGRQLMAIIDSIVDLAKAETGQLELDPEPVDMRQLCEQSVQQARKLLEQFTWLQEIDLPQADRLEAEIQLDIDPNIKMLVADGVRLQQMLVNLLSNALKFTEAEQQPKVGLTVRPWGGWIAFTVWDRGIGIPEDKQHLVFQKFQQVESTLTRQYDGAGLGLVLTRHLARLHGGDVTFASKVGVGSQFTILLPPEPPEAGGLNSVQVSIIPSRLVLVVETDSQDVDRLITILTAKGYRVVVARSGTEALEKARRLQPCLILLSPDLPMLSGWDVLALLKQDQATRDIRVVMTIAPRDEKRDGDRVDGLLLKPVQPSDLNIFLPRLSVEKDPLTLLYLGEDPHELIISLVRELGHHLLEAHDVEQGEMLVRIWHPNLILLGCNRQELSTHLDRLSRCATLPNLPIMLLDEVDPALQQKYPKLDLHSTMKPLSHQTSAAELNRVLQFAVGHLQAPTILLFSLSNIDAPTQSLHQYLLSAGFYVRLLNQPDLLPEQLQLHSADVLIVTLHGWNVPDPEHLSTCESLVNWLGQNAEDFPIVVVDSRSEADVSSIEVVDRLVQMATTVLKQSDAMTGILSVLHQCLALD